MQRIAWMSDEGDRSYDGMVIGCVCKPVGHGAGRAYETFVVVSCMDGYVREVPISKVHP